jgi:hypothetical protein
MWKVLGVETILVDADKVWVDQLLALSQRRKDSPKFRELLAMAVEFEGASQLSSVGLSSDEEQDDPKKKGSSRSTKGPRPGRRNRP